MEREEVQQMIDDAIDEHEHNGNQARAVDWRELVGAIKTQDSVPTHVPRSVDEQVIIHINGGTLRLYVYDLENGNWRYATLT